MLNRPLSTSFAIALCLAGSTSAADPATTLAELTAAGAARSAAAEVRHQAAQERQRLEAAIALVTAETQDAISAQREAEAMSADVERQLAELTATGDLAPVQARLSEVAAALHHDLEHLAQGAIPGVVEVPPTGGHDPFGAMARTLEEAQRRAREVALSTLEGELDGTPLVVRALRVGGACAWWLALDGSTGGRIERQNGRTVLVAVTDPTQRAFIAQAMRIVDGTAAPAVVHLPLEMRP